MLVFSASGPDFDVDAFVAESGWDDATIFRRGEPTYPKPDAPRCPASGLILVIGETEFRDFATQIDDAIEFLRSHEAVVQRLAAFPGVSEIVLDFAIERRDVAVQCDLFPAELVRLAGQHGIGLELSQYPASEGESTAEIR